jgi:hypothetical protein
MEIVDSEGRKKNVESEARKEEIKNSRRKVLKSGSEL